MTMESLFLSDVYSAAGKDHKLYTLSQSEPVFLDADCIFTDDHDDNVIGFSSRMCAENDENTKSWNCLFSLGKTLPIDLCFLM